MSIDKTRFVGSFDCTYTFEVDDEPLAYDVSVFVSDLCSLGMGSVTRTIPSHKFSDVPSFVTTHNRPTKSKVLKLEDTESSRRISPMTVRGCERGVVV